MAASQRFKVAHRRFEGGLDFGVVRTLGNFALHVAVLILDNACHNGIVGVKQVR